MFRNPSTPQVIKSTQNSLSLFPPCALHFMSHHSFLQSFSCLRTYMLTQPFHLFCNLWFQSIVFITIYTHKRVYNPSRTFNETVVALSGPGWWGVINFCTTLLLPSASPLPPVFIFGSCPAHSCVIAVAQCLGCTADIHTQVHIRTQTQVLFVCVGPPTHPTRHYTILPLPPIFSCLLYIPPAPRAERWDLFTAGGYSCWLNKWARAGS